MFPCRCTTLLLQLYNINQREMHVDLTVGKYSLYAEVHAGLKAGSSKAFLQCTEELAAECFGNGRYYSLRAVPLDETPKAFQEQGDWNLAESSTEDI